MLTFGLGVLTGFAAAVVLWFIIAVVIYPHVD